MAFLDEAEIEVKAMELDKDLESELLAEIKEINDFEDSLPEIE